MKCVTLIFLVLILIFLITFCGYRKLYSTNINSSETNNNLTVTGLSADYNKLSIARRIPDTRDSSCPRIFNNLNNLKAKVSVIITYHNESLYVLQQTIDAIYNRTPLRYLQEVIILDDCSEDVAIVHELERRYKFLNFIKFVRNSKRLGLIQSRNLGAKISLGNYLMFLDSHCEVNAQWLETLLDALAKANNTRLALSPVLDNIDGVTNTYKATAALLKGGFDWNLHFHWFRTGSKPNRILPFRSPIFAGGIFLISRNWFFRLKAFNTRLQIWGGESLEFSLKLWLCGGDKGEIKIVPCSRVGHIFRKEHVFLFPNNDGQQIYLRNSKIIAEMWLEHYKYIFYNHKPEAKYISINETQVEDKRFKDALKCHKFEWYLQNIFPELRPFENYSAFDVITSSAFVAENLCLHHDEIGGSKLIMCNCLTAGITRWFLLKSTKQLQSNKGLCVNVIVAEEVGLRKRKFKVSLENCAWPSDQSWQRFGLQFRHAQTGLCLEISIEYEITINPCRRSAVTQYFIFDKELEKL